jgi:hypothetical protein
MDFRATLFSSSRAGGFAARQRLNENFAASFAHIFAACSEVFEIAEDKAAALLGRIRSGSRETPFLFSLHFKLLEAIEADRLDEVEALVGRILALGPAAPGIRFTSLGPDEFPWDADMVADYFSNEPDALFRYVAPDPALLPARKEQLTATLALLHRTVPGLAEEIEELVTTIILARGVLKADESAAIEPFQGASALRAFGAVMFDATPDPTLVECAAYLVHEEAHNLLFALAPMDGVVFNPDTERHASPLRDDPRPLEGIHHATFVLARIVYAMQAMIESGLLEDADRALAAEIAATNRPLFFDGLETLRAHARMTEPGEDALGAAEAYMAATA